MSPHVKQKVVAVSCLWVEVQQMWQQARENVPVTFFVSLFDEICWLNIWKIFFSYE